MAGGHHTQEHNGVIIVPDSFSIPGPWFALVFPISECIHRIPRLRVTHSQRNVLMHLGSNDQDRITTAPAFPEFRFLRTALQPTESGTWNLEVNVHAGHAPGSIPTLYGHKSHQVVLSTATLNPSTDSFNSWLRIMRSGHKTCSALFGRTPSLTKKYTQGKHNHREKSLKLRGPSVGP